MIIYYYKLISISIKSAPYPTNLSFSYNYIKHIYLMSATFSFYEASVVAIFVTKRSPRLTVPIIYQSLDAYKV